MLKFYIVGWSGVGERKVLEGMGFSVVNTIEDCDVLLFTGGADISPSIYTQPPHDSVYADESRDKRELEAFHKGRELGKGFFGICRGAQLLCACAGGYLIQDVRGHNRGPHGMITNSGAKILATSVHHQMMVPPEGAIIEGWADFSTRGWLFSPDRGTFHMDEIPAEDSVEAVYFPNINAFGVQGHPEYMLGNVDYAPYRAFVKQMLLKYFGDVIDIPDETQFTLTKEI